jgi:hypothetical protein
VRRSALLHLKNMGVTMTRSGLGASTAAGNVATIPEVRSAGQP